MNHGIISSMKKGVWLWLLLGLVAVSIVFWAVRAAGAISIVGNPKSPNPYASYITNQPSFDDMTNHIMIYSNHGVATSLSLAAYFAHNATAQRDLVLETGDPSICRVSNSGGKRLKDKVFYTLTVNNGSPNPTAADTKTYAITGENACARWDAGNLINARAQTFTIPASVIKNAPIDSLTGKKKISITFALNTSEFLSLREIESSTEQWYGEQVISFRAKLQPSSGSTPDDSVAPFLGNTDTSASSANNANNGLVTIQGNPSGLTRDKDGQNVTAFYPFGRPCNDTTPFADRDVLLYDADVKSDELGSSKDSGVYFTIWELRNGAWTQIKESAANGDTTRLAMADPNVGVYEISDGKVYPTVQENNATKVVVKNMKANTRYRIQIDRLYHRGQRDAKNNYLYVGLPGDSIYGLEGFTCPAYEVQPFIGISPTTVEPQGSIHVTPTLANNSSAIPAKVGWQVTGFWLNPGVAVPNAAGGEDTKDACQYFGGNGCNLLSGSSGTTEVPIRGTISLGDRDYMVPVNAPFGANYCFVTSTNPYSDKPEGQRWRHSAPKCAVVGLKPKLQVWGHDALAGGTVQTSLSQRTTAMKYFGSWDEYGVFSGALNMTMASGAGLNGGNVSGTNTSWNKVTGANYMVPCTGSGGGDGCFGPVAYPVAIVEKAAALAVNTDYNPSGRCDAGDITVDSIPNPNSITGTRVICTTGTVTINKNLQYHTTPLSQGLPQVLIIAKNIQIDPGVTRVDAWLIAGYKDGSDGALYTCTGWKDVSTKLTANDCNNKLEINGPVVAPKIYLGRTHGVRDPNPDEPAERIQLRGDTYVWASQGSSGVSAETAALRELPPRY